MSDDEDTRPFVAYGVPEQPIEPSLREPTDAPTEEILMSDPPLPPPMSDLERERQRSRRLLAGLLAWWLAFVVFEIGLLGWVIAGKRLSHGALLAATLLAVVAALAGIAQLVIGRTRDDLL